MEPPVFPHPLHLSYHYKTIFWGYINIPLHRPKKNGTVLMYLQVRILEFPLVDDGLLWNKLWKKGWFGVPVFWETPQIGKYSGTPQIDLSLSLGYPMLFSYHRTFYAFCQPWSKGRSAQTLKTILGARLPWRIWITNQQNVYVCMYVCNVM